jgi:hypothetical protein
MPRRSIHYPEPSNAGEPQTVRNAWDNHLKKEAEANAQIEEARGEIEID